VLSLGERQRPIAEAYVNKQKQHHSEQTTLQWLEYASEIDEGPEEAGLAPESVPTAIREHQAEYLVWGEPPF
jgi:hypothetical protein